VFAPNLLWNLDNDWLSLRFQLGHGFAADSGALIQGAGSGVQAGSATIEHSGPQGLAERISWAMRWPAELAAPLSDPQDFVATALADRAAPATLWACERAENRAEGVGIVLASPEFNRR
jgi:hypothetical protein